MRGQENSGQMDKDKQDISEEVDVSAQLTAVDLLFLRRHGGYQRLLAAMRDRYRSLGRLGGHVTLQQLTEAERDVLSSHFRRSYQRQSNARIALAKFADSLAGTRFAAYSLQTLIEGFFEEPLISRSAEQEAFVSARHRYFWRQLQAWEAVGDREQIAGVWKQKQDRPLAHEQLAPAWAATWLRSVAREEAQGLRRLQQAYQRSPEQLARQMDWTARALHLLESSRSFWRLPLLAAQVTKDPHAFDLDQELGLLFVDAVCTLLDRPGYSSRQEMLEGLFQVGVLGDEITNFVTCAGLLAAGLTHDVHPIWQAAYAAGQILQVPLAWFASLSGIWSPDECCRGDERVKVESTVFVVENAGVFSALRDALVEAGLGQVPMVCTHGQVKLAGLLLLQRLAEAGTTIYYSGDFDPEGLGIAQSLAQRCGERFHFWHWQQRDCQQAASHKPISARRLTMLDSINQPELQAAVTWLRAHKCAGYQEALLSELTADVLQWASGAKERV